MGCFEYTQKEVERMQIEMMHISQVTPYEHNPRINEAAVEVVAESISEFGFKNPIIVDEHHVIVNGHTRLKAAKKLGLETVPVIVADDLTDEQTRAFRLVDNKTAEFAMWDEEKLQQEIDDILDIDLNKFGFEELIEEAEQALEEENIYTDKIQSPQYEPKRDEKPSLSQLVDKEKYKELERRIRLADLPEDIEEFLLIAATRHYLFDYGEIAEYYAHSDKQVQKLFEDSALVIIDFDDAIKNGYVKTVESLDEMSVEDEEI
jgi:hypothetical protein